MFAVYLDDSGTAPEHKVAIATGIIIPASRILALESEWKTLAAKERFTFLHTSEFAFRNKKSEFANWDEAKQERVLHRVLQICRKYGTKAFSFAVDKTDYDSVIPDDWRNHFGRYHYTWAIRHVLHLIDTWRLPRVREPLEYIFSWIEPKDLRRKEIDVVMAQAEEIAIAGNHAGDYVNYSFRSPPERAGLQCVDAVSWICYRVSLRNFGMKPIIPLAAMAEKELDKNEWLVLTTVTRENLQSWISKEMRNPVAIAHFEKSKHRIKDAK